MWLWIFIFCMDMLIPFMMIGFAALWRKHPPEDINWMYGYRTERSTRNKETWKFAHQYVSGLWWKWGWGLLALTCIIFAYFFGKEDMETMKMVVTWYSLIECIPLVLVIIPTERALKKNFDSHGVRILSSDMQSKDGQSPEKEKSGKKITEIQVPAGYEIRQMELEDWRDVQDIYAQSIQEGRATFSTHIPSYETWDREHLQDCRYVITNGERVAGWCAISPMSVKSAYWGTVEVSLYIDQNHRRCGMGQALLHHLCVESEKKGYWSLYACICAENEGSIALHKKCGFRVIGRREAVAKDRFDCWQDTILMERRSKRIK